MTKKPNRHHNVFFRVSDGLPARDRPKCAVTSRVLAVLYVMRVCGVHPAVIIGSVIVCVASKFFIFFLFQRI